MQNQQFITDNQGNRVGIFLTIEEYNKILDALEELEDIRDYDMAKEKNEDTIPLREAIKLRRKHRA